MRVCLCWAGGEGQGCVKRRSRGRELCVVWQDERVEELHGGWWIFQGP